IGMVNNSYWLYEAAKELKKLGREDIVVLLIGEGQQREELEELAQKEGVNNFIRLGLMPKNDLVAYVQHAFVSLVPCKGTPVLDTSSPTKLCESFAAAVPIIQNTHGWMKDYLTERRVGYTLDPKDPKKLPEYLIKMKDELRETEEPGKRSLVEAKTYF